jgi:hypothetical protein
MFLHMFVILLWGVSGIVSADGVFALRWVAVAILKAVEEAGQKITIGGFVTVSATGLTLTILSFRALGGATIGTGMAARGAGLVVTALTGGLGCMDGGGGVGDRRRSGEVVFGEDSARDIIKGELGWEENALDLDFLEVTKQGSGGSAIFWSGL